MGILVLRTELAALCALAILTPKEVLSQEQDVRALSDSIRNRLEVLSKDSSFNLNNIIDYETVSITDSQEFNISKDRLLSEVAEELADFGYVVEDISGNVIDVLNSGAPIDEMSHELAIKGYETPNNAKIRLAAGEEWDNAKMQYIDGITTDARKTYEGRSIDDVAQKAHKATMAWAARLCPKYVYFKGNTLSQCRVRFCSGRCKHWLPNRNFDDRRL